MLRIKLFSNAHEFQKVFGLRETNNGKKVRQNKILLAHLKSQSLWKYTREHPEYSRILDAKNMAELEQMVFAGIRECSISEHKNRVQLMGNLYGSEEYTTDELVGICEDGDGKSIRYVKEDCGRVYKMKSGKFVTKIFQGCSLGRALAPQVVTYLCGDVFTQKWEAFTEAQLPKYELHVDDDFEAIYDSNRLDGNFHSCMTGEDNWTFFRDSICAKAAYLTNSDDDIVARAIIYTEVKDEYGNEYRLLERQYSTDCKDFLKRLLVDRLIAAKEIDGYKTVGASCHDTTAFVLNNGDSLSDRTLQISCDLNVEDPLSYADSFKYYDIGERIAYNDSSKYHDYCLDITEGRIAEYYDDWHDYYCTGTTEVWYRGRSYMCDSDHLDDFISVDGTYYYYDEVSTCEQCGDTYLDENGYYSKLTGEYYCCGNCMERAEEEFKEDNWAYSEYDEEYYEDRSDVVVAYESTVTFDAESAVTGRFYKKTTINRHTLQDLLDYNDAIEFEGEYYIGFDDETEMPYGIIPVIGIA